ncbi:hypothetical protein PFISCL1PPCAC_4403 [Pristionchus fissidentatus]|uniref:C2H2-type domain-containing protein n=1 Tax=Pristionchus fissidentatus TaxID=1538716 RepID=A0AAV5V1C6_9BILA|nr:hypothetical protein PFISCL1PPCAC_4403 [Pristionchus fissidentatus]
MEHHDNLFESRKTRFLSGPNGQIKREVKEEEEEFDKSQLEPLPTIAEIKQEEVAVKEEVEDDEFPCDLPGSSSHRQPLAPAPPGATKCMHCNYWSEDEAQLTRHVHTWHAESARITCRHVICDYNAADVQKRNEHEKLSHAVTKANFCFPESTRCPYCDMIVWDLKDFKTHMQTRHIPQLSNNNPILICLGCEFRCARVYEMRQHWHETRCSRGMAFDYFKELPKESARVWQGDAHQKRLAAVRQHADSGSAVARMARSGALDKTIEAVARPETKTLKRPHPNSDIGQGPLFRRKACQYCGQLCVSEAMLVHHMRLTHIEYSQRPEVIEEMEKETRPVLKCFHVVCDYSTTDPEMLERHTTSSHDAVVMKSRSFKFPARTRCPFCSVYVASLVAYKLHVARAHEDLAESGVAILVCSCGLKAARIHELFQHWRENRLSCVIDVSFDYAAASRAISQRGLGEIKVEGTME